MIAVIIDIVASRETEIGKRRELDKTLRELLKYVHNRYEEDCLALPALTQGDSLELLVSSWRPIVFVFHSLLMKELEFRVGLGTGQVTIRKKNADECDGPAFWNAREALNEIKKTKYMTRSADFRIDENSSDEESNMVIVSVLFLTSLLGMTTTQLKHCYHYIWEKKTVTEIGSIVGTSKGNVSRSLSKTPCYLLERVVAFLVSRDGP